MAAQNTRRIGSRSSDRRGSRALESLSSKVDSLAFEICVMPQVSRALYSAALPLERINDAFGGLAEGRAIRELLAPSLEAS